LQGSGARLLSTYMKNTTHETVNKTSAGEIMTSIYRFAATTDDSSCGVDWPLQERGLSSSPHGAHDMLLRP